MSGWRTTLAIGAAQTIAWASTFYLPAVLGDPMAAELRIPDGWAFASLTIALVVSGAVAPRIGRAIDRGAGRSVLAISSIVLAAGLALLGLSQNLITMLAAWVVIGLGMGLGLYDAAFAVLTRLEGLAARRSITVVTLMGGFASTIGWPATALLEDAFGWRGACLAWAGVHLAVALPLHLLLVPRAVPAAPKETPASALTGPDRTLILLVIAFGTAFFTGGALGAHLLRVLTAAGASPAEAVALGALLGPAQVAARLAETLLARRIHPLVSGRLALGSHAVGAALLGLIGIKAGLPFVVIHGAGNGVSTIARGAVPLALYGADGYGARLGWINFPGRWAQAAAPLVFGLAFDRFGLGALWITGIASLIGAGALFAIRVRPA